MREVQVTCPQCHLEYGILEPEPCDYQQGAYILFVKQCCPNCGYPDIIYNTHEEWQQ